MTRSSEKFIESTDGIGRYQWRVILIGAVACFVATPPFLVMTFTTAEPAWKCVKNSTSCTLKGSFKPGDKDYKFRCSIPRGDWKFDVKGDFDSIVTEWDLVCDKAVYAAIANSLTFVAWMFGSSLASVLSDKFGRKKVLFPSTVLVSLCGLLSAFAQKYWVFALFRALLGVVRGAYSAVNFTLVMEYIGPAYRGRVGFGMFYGWTVSIFTLSLLGYLIGSWRTLTIVASVPGLLFFVLWWFIPESLRWLMVKGRIEEAKVLFRTIAEVNKTDITKEDIALLGETCAQETAQVNHLGDIRDLFSSRKLTIRTLVSWYAWAVASMVYYGIFLSAPTVGGNMYLNLFITSLCEAIAMAIGMFALDKFGRKKTVMLSIWIAVAAMLMGAVLNYFDGGNIGYLAGKILATLVIGMFSITIVYDGMYVYSAELFPTTVRNTAVGTSSAAARIGSASTSYIIYSARVHSLLPCTIMAIFAIICGILVFLLPETFKKDMPDTVQQVDLNKDSCSDQSTKDSDNNEKKDLADNEKLLHMTCV